MATDPEELKRQQAQAPQLGMTLSPEQQRRQRIDNDMRQAAARIAETRQGFQKAASAVGGAVGTAAESVVKAGTVVPRTLYGLATGDIPVNVSHLPDYGNKGVEQRKAANWASKNPDQAEAARIGMKGIADRASSAAIGAVKSAPRGEPAAVGMKRDAAAPVPLSPQPDAPVGTDQPGASGPIASTAGPQSGRGTSTGEAGDSQMAMERFQRANDIRAQTIAESRRGQIGENGGLFIAGNGSDAMERARERREMEIANDAGLPLRAMARADDARLRRQELEQRGELDAQRLAADNANEQARLGFKAREVQNAEQTGDLERQRIGMELETGQLGLEQQRQIQQLREQLANPNLDPATREQIQRTYNTLTTPAKDRYMLQDSVMGQDALGAPVFGKQALDVVSGQLVGQGQQGGQAQAPQFQSGKIYKDASGNRARFKGMDAQGNPQWEQL